MFLLPECQQLDGPCFLHKPFPQGPQQWAGGKRAHTSRLVGSMWEAVFSFRNQAFQGAHIVRHTDGATQDLNRAFFTDPQCMSFRSSISNAAGYQNVKSVWARNTYINSHTTRNIHSPVPCQRHFSSFLILMIHFLHGEKPITKVSVKMPR